MANSKLSLRLLVTISFLCSIAVQPLMANSTFQTTGNFSLESPIVPQIEPLISPQRLVELMQTGSVQVIDIRRRTSLMELFSYDGGHIPGAVNVPFGKWRESWKDPLSVPTDADLTSLVQAAGLTMESPVVIVHSSAAKGNFGSASWVYWVLKSSGFRDIAILDGGIRGWKRAGLPISQDFVPIPKSDLQVKLDPTWLATHEDVDAVINGTSNAHLLDARPLHQVAARASLPGSAHLSHSDLVTGEAGEAGEILPIFNRLKAVAVDWNYDEVITYCNDGTLAATDWFMASEVAGIPNVRVYGHSLKARDKARKAGN